MRFRLALPAAAAALVATATVAAPFALGRDVDPAPVAVTAAQGGAARAADLTPPRLGARPGELANVASLVGATSAWAAGIDGRGIDVALIDSGVTPVPGLDSAAAVVPGPDFTDEGATAARNSDGFGHGTHLAGIIAGRPGQGTGASADFTGIAPGARVISLKVADAEERTDPADVVAAIRWVIAHRDDAGMRIRVLNLSFSSDPVPAGQSDPLGDAVHDAIAAGIVVVAAAGNGGAGTALSSPALRDDVIAVGASDPSGTVDGVDDLVADFSSTGTGTRRADVVAPGRSLLSLLAPGSAAGRDNPASVVDGHLIKGSGTSQAAAVVSGAVALLLDDQPWLTPGQVKAALVGSARPLADGSGVLDVAAALRSPAARPAAGAAAAISPAGGLLSTAVAPISAAGVNWSGVNWSGVNWSGVNWSGVNWSGVNWSGVNWSGVNWSGVNWSGVNWSGVNWSGVNWSGVNWSGVNWSGVNWSGVNWS